MLGTFGMKTSDVATLAGTGALTYLAVSPKNEINGVPTYRLGIGKSGSLLMDPRFFGTLLLGWWASKPGGSASNKAMMKQAAMAGAMSLVSTEAIRFRMKREGQQVAGGLLPDFGDIMGKKNAPAIGYDPGYGGQQRQHQYGAGVRQGAWAHG